MRDALLAHLLWLYWALWGGGILAVAVGLGTLAEDDRHAIGMIGIGLGLLASAYLWKRIKDPLD